MSNWVDKYKSLVISSHKRHIVVADQDHLFDYAELRQAFENEGYTIISCKTGLAVRLAFELQARGSDGSFLIIAPESYRPLPDIEMQVSFQAVGLPGLFPNLDAKAIRGLSFNALCLLSNIKPYEVLSHERTLKFLLENLYNVDFDTLTSTRAKERVLNAFITVFLERDGINEPLAKFLADIGRPYFPELVSKGLNNASLVKFLQDQWMSYVNEGGSLIDFNEPVLSKSLGYLFAFGHLSPIKVTLQEYEAFPRSLRIGVCVVESGNDDFELECLTEYLDQQIEVIEDIADQWFKIIQVLANAKLKELSSGNEALKAAFRKIEDAYNRRFQRYIDNTYGSLFSLSGVRKPVVVSRILEHINAKPAKKKALLVIDGMNYWQWSLLGRALTGAGIGYSTNATLAYIPTITAWSRQAIFKGDKPDLAENNSKEGKLFEDFWSKRGVPGYQITYKRFGVDEPLEVDDISPDITALGLVCNDLDDVMHGSVLGDDQLRMSTEQWVAKSRITESISALLAKGFQVYITSDHGNVQATGIGSLTLKEKVGALSRGKRHIYFTNETLLQAFIEQNPGLELGRKGLSLYLKKKEAFITGNSRVITHGGSHIWEVIVPFISIYEQ